MVDPARLDEVTALLRQAELADFADLRVTAYNRVGELAPLLTVCPPEHLSDPEKFKKGVLGIVARALEQ